MAQPQFDQTGFGNVDPAHARAIEQRLELVHQGMKVVDAAGHDIGHVDYVKMGDPDAVTDRGELPAHGGAYFVPPEPLSGSSSGPIVAPFWPAGDNNWGPDVPEPIKARLLRVGYFKVDGPFLFGKDRYVRADYIAGVADDTVTLRVDKDRLPVEE